MSEAALNDLPPSLAARRVVISRACAAIVLATALFQVVALFVEVNEWLAMGLLYLSSSALGLDAVVRGVRKRSGEGPSIRNLAPGGWAIFAGMFWIVAVPAYFFGARRRAVDEPESVRAGSYFAIALFAALGLALCAIGAELTCTSP